MPQSALDSLRALYIGRTMGVSTCRSLEQEFARYSLARAVRVVRMWPNILQVDVEERALAARAAGPRPLVIDTEGWQHDIRAAPDSLPLLRTWREAEKNRWVPVLEMVTRLRRARPRLLSESVIPALPRNGLLEIELTSAPLRLFLPFPPDEGLLGRFTYMAIVVADARARGECPRTVDLRWINQIVLGFDEGDDTP